MNDIAVGDEMVITTYGLGGGLSLHRVEKVLKRYFVCGGCKWSRASVMRLIGKNSWNTSTIRRATERDKVVIAAARRRRVVAAYKWSSADKEVIDAVYEIIKERPAEED